MTRTVSMFIDDLRFPADPSQLIFRTSASALEFLQHNLSQVVSISFDHDLGGDDTTRPVAAWLEELAYNDGKKLLINTSIHSANPVGREWLRQALIRGTHFHNGERWES